MSNAPQFPDPLGVREVYRPGATAHKAGPDIVRRVQNLEQGAAGRPGPGVSNGSVLTSDTTQTGGVKWVAPTARLKAGTFSVPGSTGNLAVTGLGFKPGMVLFTCSWTSLTSDAFQGSGAMDAAGNQWLHALNVNGSGRSSLHATNKCIGLYNHLNAAYYEASFVSMDTDGFTINFSTISTSGRVSWVAYL